MKLTVKDSTNKDKFGPPEGIVLNNKIISVRVLEISQNESPFPENEDDPTGPRKLQLSFKFECLDDINGWPESKGSWFWGNTGVNLTNNSKNKLYQWICALYQVDSIAPDYEVDLEELIGLECRAQLTVNENGNARVKSIFAND